MSIDKAGQVTDDENSGKNDPNAVGSGQMKPVRDDRAGKMTPSCQYGDVVDYPAGQMFSRNG
jgi:hypothetical protein